MNTPIGFIISWNLPAVISLADLRAGLTQAGLDPDLAPDLRPASLVARSASFVAKTTSGKDHKKLARKLDHTTRQITREDATPGSLTYTREAGIAYDDAAGKLVTDDPFLAQSLDQTAQHITETRTASDVTRIVQRIVEQAGSDLIPVREQGGAYFVPQGSGVIGQVSVVLNSIGGALTQFACTLGHGTTASVANVITDYMLKQIAELQESVEELNEKGIRADVKSRRLTRVAELRERVAAYASLVTTQGSKLTEAIDKAEAALLAKLGPTRDEESDATPAEIGQGELVMSAK